MKTMSEERAAFEDYCREIGYTLKVCDSGRYLGGYGAELWAGFKTGAAWQRAQSAGVPLVMAADYAALEAECDALRQQRDKLAGFLREAKSAYAAAIHWTDMRATMAKIDAALSELTP